MKTIFINGLSGKMGKTINNLILDDADFEIVKGQDRTGQDRTGQDLK